MVSPTVAMPVDLALTALIPLHAHVGMNFVITDYGPKFFPTKAGVMGLRYGMIGASPRTQTQHTGRGVLYELVY